MGGAVKDDAQAQLLVCAARVVLASQHRLGPFAAAASSCVAGMASE